jgi:hypothetical protein
LILSCQTANIIAIHPVISLYKTNLTISNIINCLITDKLLFKLYFVSTDTINNTANFYTSGGLHNSYTTTPSIFSHNEMENIQGGDQYNRFHLSQQQYNLVTQNATSQQTGLLLNNDWFKFNNKADQTLDNTYSGTQTFNNKVNFTNDISSNGINMNANKLSYLSDVSENI